MCFLCEGHHNNHEKEYYGNIICKKEEAIKRMETLRKEIDIILKNIQSYIYKLSKTKDYVNAYYNICNDIINNYDTNKKNYKLIQNVNEVYKEQILLNEIKNIGGREIKNVFNLYDKMASINELNIIYNKNNAEKIKIFGKDFVKNNKSKCKIVYENKEQELTEYFDTKKINANAITIKLLNINNIENIGYMFHGCSALASLPNISNWIINNVKDMQYMFYGCSSLSSLPDILIGILIIFQICDACFLAVLHYYLCLILIIGILAMLIIYIACFLVVLR